MSKLFYRFIEPQLLAGMALHSIILACILIYVWRHRGVLSLTLLGYYLICSSLIFIYYYKPFFPTPPDSITYNKIALNVSDKINSDFFNLILSTELIKIKSFGYTVPLGIIYYLFADSIVAGELFNAACGVLALYQLYHVTRNLFGEKTARYAVVLMAASPYLWFMTIVLLRETLFILMILTFFRILQTIEKNKTFLNYGALVITLLYIGILRIHFIAVLLLVISLYIIINRIFSKRNKIEKIMEFQVYFLSILIITGLFYIYIDLIKAIITKYFFYTDVDYLAARVDYSSQASSGYVQNIKYNNYKDIIMHLPLLVVFFLCSPFPWQVEKLSQGIALMDSSFLWLVYIFFLAEVRHFWRANQKWAVIIFIYLATGIAGAAAMQGNLGAAERHRLPFTVIFLPVAANHLCRMRDRKNKEHKQMPANIIPLGKKRLVPGRIIVAPRHKPPLRGKGFILQLAGGQAKKLQMEDQAKGRVPPLSMQVCQIRPVQASLPDKYEADGPVPLDSFLIFTQQPIRLAMNLKFPETHPPGSYYYNLVLHSGTLEARLLLELTVWGFTLPKDLPITIILTLWPNPEWFRR